jgi:uncharacterized protein YndB with AHSA1/START domain
VTDASSGTRSVVVEREIPHPPDKVWRALTQPHLVAEWLRMANDLKPVVGHGFTLRGDTLRGDWGGVGCKVLAVEPSRTLSYAWDHAHDDAAHDPRSVVAFTLTPTSTGTRLRLEQQGFRPDQRQAHGGAQAGWRQHLSNLEAVVARAG